MKENIRTIIIALLIALGVRTVAFEPFKIPSESMLPTLLVGDFLFVSKYSYGYSQYSLMLAPIPFSGRIFGSEPKRGDVAVFRNPRNGQNFIKRVVGLPGDRMAVRNGRLMINGTVLERIPAIERVEQDDFQNAQYFTEVLPPSKPGDEPYRHIIRELYDADQTSERTVPEGHFFMMGDNRDNSTDSRFPSAVGFVPFENFVGKAEILFFSIDMDGAPFYHFWKWPLAIRYDRLFDRIR